MSSIRALRAHYTNDATYAKSLTAMCALLRANPAFSDKHSAKAKAWRDALAVASDATKEAAKRNVISPGMRARWASIDDLEELAERLTDDPDAHADLRASQDVVLVVLSAYMPPKRADFGELRVVTSQAELKDGDNGVVLPTRERALRS